MERYFKISESELLKLLTSTISRDYLYLAGVDNLDGGSGEIERYFSEDCKAAGLPEDPKYGYTSYSYEDLAKIMLKNYQEVK